MSPASPLGAAAGAAAALPTTSVLAPRVSPAPPRRATTWLALALLLLLAVNAALYWRLYHAPPHRGMDLNHLHTRMSTLSEAQAAEWARALERHSHRQRGQLIAWRDALDRTVAHLVQTERALTKLLETIKPALEKAEQEAEPRDDL